MLAVLVFLLVSSKSYDIWLVLIASLDTFVLGMKWGRDPNYFKRYLFWRK